MTEALVLLAAGVGLSFFGLELVTSALQDSTSRTVRALIKQSTRSIPGAALIGVVAGALVQSTSAVAAVLGSMMSGGLITFRQALPVVAFANVGTTVLVFAGALDIRLAVLLAIGLFGTAYSLSGEFRWKAAAATGLGVALVLYGSDLMTTAASAVQEAAWFGVFLRRWHDSMVMAFALGSVASFLTQSTTLVALMTIAISSARLVDGPAALAMLYGANLGSTVMRLLLTRHSSGAQRQMSRFQDVFKITGTAIFVALLVAERQFSVPGVFAAINRLPASFPVVLASANLALNGSMALVASFCAAPIARAVARTWPLDVGEDLAIPLYAVPEAVGDPGMAVDLLEKEQRRMLEKTRDYMTIIRAGGVASGRTGAIALHRRFVNLFREIGHFHTTLVGKQLDVQTSDWISNVHGRQQVVELLEDSLHHLTISLEAPWRIGPLEPLIENMIETLDFLLIVAGDAARTLEFDRAHLVLNLSGDRSEMMASVRNLYLSSEHSLNASERTLLVRVTALFERIVWMVQRFAELLLRNINAEDNGRDDGLGIEPDAS